MKLSDAAKELARSMDPNHVHRMPSTDKVILWVTIAAIVCAFMWLD